MARLFITFLSVGEVGFALHFPAGFPTSFSKSPEIKRWKVQIFRRLLPVLNFPIFAEKFLTQTNEFEKSQGALCPKSDRAAPHGRCPYCFI
ncbi:hypothetical protein NC99_01510 [Sunxiuqinia dokdonensis]|uniref:Uncharacterized protein n=1 Tax=Sunxiuqinia dokdonensis TaxID=1409788 RepID=A0A0L8VEX9_9BACT|nr:hypothetical protein NC99_01510 [Sunxiuqinia dokdonensis]